MSCFILIIFYTWHTFCLNVRIIVFWNRSTLVILNFLTLIYIFNSTLLLYRNFIHPYEHRMWYRFNFQLQNCKIMCDFIISCNIVHHCNGKGFFCVLLLFFFFGFGFSRTSTVKFIWRLSSLAGGGSPQPPLCVYFTGSNWHLSVILYLDIKIQWQDRYSSEAHYNYQQIIL